MTVLANKLTDVERSGRKLTFVVHGMPTYAANALRRVLLAEVPCVGIPNIYRDANAPKGSVSPGVSIHTNTGRLHNEFFRHRLSLLPISIDPAMLQQHRLFLKLSKDCSVNQEGPLVVTSADVQLCTINDEGDHVVIENPTPYLLPGATEVIPVDPTVQAVLGDTVQPGILLTRLYPDESLDLTMYPCVGCARDYAGFAPLHTCTMEHLLANGDSADDVNAPQDALTAAFRFTVHGLGVSQPTALVRDGLKLLEEKVERFHWGLEKNTVELDFGPSCPSLHSVLKCPSQSKPASVPSCWVQWSNVDFLTSLNEHESFYQRYCKEVLAVTCGTDEQIISNVRYTERVPTVDSEDLMEAMTQVTGPAGRHVLALHQPDFNQTGIYEYDRPNRQFRFATSIDKLDAMYYIAKEGKTKRAQVFTPAKLVSVQGSKCVIQFNNTLSATIFEHVSNHVQAVIAADVNGSCHHLPIPKVAREPIDVTLIYDPSKNIDLDVKEAPGFAMTLDKEDHTLGNLVQGHIYDKTLKPFEGKKTDASVDRLLAVGYHQPLPSEKKIRFRFEFTRARTPDAFVKFLIKELSVLRQQLHKVSTMWDEVSS